MSGPVWRLSAPAAGDLIRIGRQSARRWGARHAVRYLGRIESRFDFLLQHPDLGTPRNDVRPGLRSFPEGAHIIYYRQTENGIRILRIRHRRMDPRRLIVPE
jgi:toxin ParE1/3/4